MLVHFFNSATTEEKMYRKKILFVLIRAVIFLEFLDVKKRGFFLNNISHSQMGGPLHQT